MKLAIYAPDRHISYDGSTPDRVGVGGGITFRVRIAAALARAGHSVEVVCNCAAPVTVDDVLYVPLDDVSSLSADIIFLHSSSGAGSGLLPARGVAMQSAIRILVVSGGDAPQGWVECRPDGLIVPSNFVRCQVAQSWSPAPPRLFVSHHGVSPDCTPTLPADPHRLIYASHPSKGLDAALAVLRILRQSDPAFHLDIYGGNRLWGGADEPVSEPGVSYFGLTPAPTVERAYRQSAFALNLQRRQEPFGLALIDAVAAGCIAIASPVGAFPEILDSGRNGFLVEGDAEDPAVHRRAAELIAALKDDPAWMQRIRAQAACDPLQWDQVASAWLSFCRILLGYPSNDRRSELCPHCGCACWELSDGFHCSGCGHYSRRLA